MSLTRDKELWAMALWVEKHHGADGHRFIQERIEHYEADEEPGGAKLWRAVAERYSQIQLGPIPIHGQPGTLPN
ncbi:DUF6961 family protein [Erythrobacter sp. GH1-10]|uniref:DUF6961 family protein n=1 Tax=Erythrobacter sp. GH1-10 TaxID=3349334 RepID=UPI003877B3CA